MNEKKFILGQYFTKKEVVDRVIRLLLKYNKYNKDINILEPSSGTGNFIKGLKEKGFTNIQKCEIDEKLTDNSCDFFLFDLDKKFDLIIGNPPFTKYNVKKSYYNKKKYLLSKINPLKYLTEPLIKKDKIQIENAFILKSIKHLKNKTSSIGFVLPISFFIAKKNKEIKKVLIDRFNTIVIYQNDKNMVDEPIPCCFAIFTNTEMWKNKVIIIFEDGITKTDTMDKSALTTEELIPKPFMYRKNNHQEGSPLSNYLSDKIIKYQRDYKKNNISGANILQHQEIPKDKNVQDYALAVTRVGNVSVGKTGLINVKEDILNDMFYVFKFKNKFNKNKKLKEEVCRLINQNQEHFKNITHRVGSKSIKKSDVLDFKVKI